MPLLPPILLLLLLPGGAPDAITATEPEHVWLPCRSESSSQQAMTETVWRKDGEDLLRVSLSPEVVRSMNGRLEVMGDHRAYLVLKNLSTGDSGIYHCFSGHTANGSFLLNISEHEHSRFNFPPGSSAYLPCEIPDSGNRISNSWKSVKNISNKDTNFSVTIDFRPGARPLGAALNKMVDLYIPAVTPEDAGVYNCSWGESFNTVELKVIAQSWWRKLFGDTYWILLIGTLGPLVLSAVLFCVLLLVIKKIKARRKHQKATLRSFFRIASSNPNTYTDMPGTLFTEKLRKAPDKDGDSYENVELGPLAEDPKKLRRKTVASSGSFDVSLEDEGSYMQPSEDEEQDSDDEGSYMQPSKDEEQDSDDGACYENTNEEAKTSTKDNHSDDGVSYMNPMEEVMEAAKDNISTDGTCYENPAGLAKMMKEDNISYDGECYENSENLPIKGHGHISGFLSPNPSCTVVKTDGESDKSTGSQSYEDMEGAIYMAPASNLLQSSDRSQEDDGDSYETMDGQALSIQPNQRNSQIEDYEKMDKSRDLTLHSGDQTMNGTQLLQEDGDFYLTFETWRPSGVQKIPSFKIEDHDDYDDVTHCHALQGIT